MRDRYSRRHVLRTLAACAAASLPSLSSAESAKRGRIDVHIDLVTKEVANSLGLPRAQGAG